MRKNPELTKKGKAGLNRYSNEPNRKYIGGHGLRTRIKGNFPKNMSRKSLWKKFPPKNFFKKYLIVIGNSDEKITV